MDEGRTGQVSTEAAELYQRFFVPALFAQFPEPLLELADVSPGQSVIDVGCGTGVLTRAALARVGPEGRVRGVDVNVEMLRVAQASGAGIEWETGAAESLSAPDQDFDRVVSQFALMFFVDRAAAVAEMARVLRPKGRACVATWAQVAESPGYAALMDLLGELFGEEAALALAAPFAIGTAEALEAELSRGFEEVTIHRVEGTAHFASLDDWLTTDVRAWTLSALIDDAQFEAFAPARAEAAGRVRRCGGRRELPCARAGRGGHPTAAPSASAPELRVGAGSATTMRRGGDCKPCPPPSELPRAGAEPCGHSAASGAQRR